jgi:hypothetical protein
MKSLEITEDDIKYFKHIHPDKSAITVQYRIELFNGLIERIKSSYFSSTMVAKEFYDTLTSDFKKVPKVTDEQVNKAVKCISMQLAVAGRIKNNYIKVADKEVVGLSIYTETGRKGDLYYALAETVEFIIVKHNIIPGIVQWAENEGYVMDKRFYPYVIPRSHVLEPDSQAKLYRKRDIESLLTGLKIKADISKIKYNQLVIQKR